MSPTSSISEANNNTSMPSQQTAIVNFDEIKTLTTQNGGKKRPRIFSDAEFERRLSNIRDYMEKEVNTLKLSINICIKWIRIVI